MQPRTLEKIFIADRLTIPANTQAVLWDMDGVLLDSLQLDFILCNQLLADYFGEHVALSRTLIRSLFAYDPLTFWQFILSSMTEAFQLTNTEKFLPEIVERYEQARRDCTFALNVGVAEILTAMSKIPLKMAVVSNNTTADIRKILTRSNIVQFFDQFIGHDIQQIAKKPAPDPYLLATQLLAVDPKRCVVIEDSLLGLESGYQAHCYTIAVATGGADFKSFADSILARQIYQAFEKQHCELKFGQVRQKNIQTPNEFVSHMLEHIMWRLGVEIDLRWYSDDWWSLGYFVGQKIKTFAVQEFTGVALGMIDDGSAEVIIKIADLPALTVETISNVDKDWFLALRCEQLRSGQPLIALMQGLTEGLLANITVKICSVEDPHHSWEGVFRALGIALNQIFTPRFPVAFPFDLKVEKVDTPGDLRVLARALHYSQVFRGTAESHVVVAVDFSKQQRNQFIFTVDSSINVTQLPTLLALLAVELDCTLQVEFNATALSSSHVVLEDTALVLGRALLEILKLRMEHWGVNGAGSSVRTEADFAEPIRVGVSVEGRKFWKFVPFDFSMDELRKQFIIGQMVCDTLRSEDLDDFLDGLAGGLAASIIVHIATPLEANLGWQKIFKQLGKALQMVFMLNPYRKGVPPGVKATLA